VADARSMGHRRRNGRRCAHSSLPLLLLDRYDGDHRRVRRRHGVALDHRRRTVGVHGTQRVPLRPRHVRRRPRRGGDRLLRRGLDQQSAEPLNRSTVPPFPSSTVPPFHRSHTRTFNSRPGTKITFFGAPVTNFAIPGSAVAAASAASCPAPAGTCTVPRILPFTCTAIVTMSSTSIAGS